MRVILKVWSVVVLLSLCAAAQPKAQTAPTVSKVMDSQLKSVEGEFVSAAEAMPEEKYTFAPTEGEFKGVRDFGTQVKHVATVNYLVGAAMQTEKSPVDVSDENGPASMTKKDDIVKYLKDSFAYLHKAYAGLNEKNAVELVPSPFGQGKSTRLGMATLIVGHCFDHYGQMVEYLRMNSIIPPASRPPAK